ncbi:MAG: adenylate/guanylate cyclase domain-containing protein [Geminicoccaceae bacterium]|nr:MAG: adenylate/guanylate cyclase domain-containing protein [Geminicoccaceae bacterium]
MNDDPRIGPLRDWLLGEGARLRFLERLLAAFGARLGAAGLPIDRASLHARILHPQFMGARLVWVPGEDQAAIYLAGHDLFTDPVFQRSPVRLVFEGADGLRQRLEWSGDDDEFPILTELRAAGFTDYVAMPLPLSTGQRLAATWATRRPGGFATDELLVLDALAPVLAMAAEVRLVRRLARTLATTYLGERTGEWVLEGRIRRGDLERIEAVVWFLDMRDFTALAERLDPDRLIDRLNRFFEAFGAPIAAHGGEILKFIGDAMLAVFTGPADEPCRALAAARAGFANLDALNAALLGEGQPAIDCGLALHRGSLSYGNIGTATRLDFTVIGPAVNEAARLQRVGRDLGAPLILSASFAGACGAPTRSLGHHSVAGLERPIEVFAPA